MGVGCRILIPRENFRFSKKNILFSRIHVLRGRQFLLKTSSYRSSLGVVQSSHKPLSWVRQTDCCRIDSSLYFSLSLSLSLSFSLSLFLSLSLFRGSPVMIEFPVPQSPGSWEAISGLLMSLAFLTARRLYSWVVDACRR